MSTSMHKKLGDHPRTPGRSRSTLLRACALLFAALGVGAAASAGCSSTPPAPPPFCPGGFVREVPGSTPGTTQKTCEALCNPSSCANPGNVCVNNQCVLPCMSELDCPQPGQDCVAAHEDGPDGGMGAAVDICQPNGKAPIGMKCPLGSECKGLMACPDGSSCDYSQCGGNTCNPSPLCTPGQKCTVGDCGDGVTCSKNSDCSTNSCTNGKCACSSNSDCSSGACINGACEPTPCTPPGCTQDKCVPLSCASNGVGDAEAYCTIHDCHQDADCPGGFWCATVDDPHQICGAPTPNAQTCGNPPTCTQDSDCGGAGSKCTSGKCSCVMANASDGTTYQQGNLCTLRNVCRPRRLCDPCTTDIDCSGLAEQHQHCTTMPKDGMKFCTTDCGSDSDCGSGFACTNGECVPRYGTCKGMGNFCEPCLNEKDCGSGMGCFRPSNTGVERVCFSVKEMSCTTDNNCPTSPSGVHGACLGVAENLQQGEAGYDTCYFPYNTASDSFACWPGNTGYPCYKSSECVSKSCKGANVQQMMPGTCQ